MNNRRRIYFAQQARWFTDYMTDADAKAEKARVEADGGSDVNLIELSNFFKLVKGYSGAFEAMELCTGKDFGVKKDGSNYASKWYDVSTNDRDEAQATGSAQPLFSSLGIICDGSNDFMLAPLDFRLVANYTFTARFKPTTMRDRNAIIFGDSINTGTPFIALAYYSALTLKIFVDGNFRHTMTGATTTDYIVSVVRTFVSGTTYNYRFFINGSLVGTYAGTNAHQGGARRVYVGTGYPGFADASYTHISVFSSALSDEAVIAIHNFYL